MEVLIQLHTTTLGGDIHPDNIIISEAPDSHLNPRMGFFQKFLCGVLARHYPALHSGEVYKEDHLNCTFKVHHLHVTMDSLRQGEKRVILTGTLTD